MTKEEFEKAYYADRPTEPYSADNGPNDWANIAHYAEENLEKAFEQIVELEKENEELRSVSDFQTSSNIDRYFQSKRGKERLTKAEEIIRDLLGCLYSVEYDHTSDLEEAEQFLEEMKENESE